MTRITLRCGVGLWLFGVAGILSRTAEAVTNSETTRSPGSIMTVSPSPPQSESHQSDATSRQSTTDEEPLLAVFSDIDGTLVHYPESHDLAQDTKEGWILLPRSKTGTVGVISELTIESCQALRRKGVRLVLVTGARTSTLLQRLPYLPLADAYVTENGGRIFYPTKEPPPVNSRNQKCFVFEHYSEPDNQSVTIVEDSEWRQHMQSIVDSSGYPGNEMNDGPAASRIALPQRQGVLWEYARKLEQTGIVLDTNGYATCFRINRKQQRDAQIFDDLLRQTNDAIVQLPDGLVSSINLGCMDVYPGISGKKNACQYLAQKMLGGDGETVLAQNCVCLCDDDNDLAMAKACRHAYLPGLSSESMKKAVQVDRGHYTYSEDLEGTEATEAALREILLLSTSIQ